MRHRTSKMLDFLDLAPPGADVTGTSSRSFDVPEHVNLSAIGAEVKLFLLGLSFGAGGRLTMFRQTMPWQTDQGSLMPDLPPCRPARPPEPWSRPWPALRDTRIPRAPPSAPGARLSRIAPATAPDGIFHPVS